MPRYSLDELKQKLDDKGWKTKKRKIEAPYERDA